MKPDPDIAMRRPRMRPPRARRPAAAQDWRPASILVPVDFSYAADRALRLAVRLARRLRARITLLHVVAPAGVPEVLPRSLRPDLAQLAALSKERLARLARRQGFRPAGAIVKTGHAAQEILQHADQMKAGLIVIGARGHGTLKRMLLGSTAERVVRHAPCPVMVIPLPKADGTTAGSRD